MNSWLGIKTINRPTTQLLRSHFVRNILLEKISYFIIKFHILSQTFLNIINTNDLACKITPIYIGGERILPRKVD